MLEAVEQVAVTDATVLIVGETGTGKELIARAIHQRSHRAKGPLIKFNCAAIPETLLASEPSGHERGAFTGAVERRKGRFEQAHGGTLFLDEIGESPWDYKCCCFESAGSRFEWLGGSDPVQVDVRIIAGTNSDLTERVRAGKFRSDLYYRLNVFPRACPPLRERREDIPSLVAHFAAKHGERFGRVITRIDRRSMSYSNHITGPATCANWKTSSNGQSSSSRDGTLRIDRDAFPSGRGTNLHGQESRTQDPGR